MRNMIESDETMESILASITEGENRGIHWNEFRNGSRIVWKEINCVGGLIDVINPYDFPRLLNLSRKPARMASSKYLVLSGASWRFPPRMGLTMLSIPCYSQINFAYRFRGPESEQSFYGDAAYVLAIGDNVSFKVSGRTRNNQPLIITFY